MPYDVVHRDPRFDLANVSYVHYHPAGDPAAAGSLAVLRQLSLVSFGNGPVQVKLEFRASPMHRWWQ